MQPKLAIDSYAITVAFFAFSVESVSIEADFSRISAKST
jgi:hypothetical protein